MFGQSNPNFNNNQNNNQATEENYKKELELDNETYILQIKKTKPSQISIKCENKFDYLAMHDYSINLTYDEFCKLAKTFRLFDNIDEIFDTIKNLFKGVNFSFIGNQFNNINNPFNYRPEGNVKLERSMNGSINLILKIPLLNEKYENIKIEFKKEKKDINKQFEKLKNKFLKIKKIAFSDEPQSQNWQNNQNNNNQMNIQTFNNININQCNFNNCQQMNMNNMQQGMQQSNFNNNFQKSQAQIKSSAQTILDRIKNEFRGNSLQ